MKTAFFSQHFLRTYPTIESQGLLPSCLTFRHLKIGTAMLNDESTNKKLLRILYADDVRELRDVARIALSREGHLIECVADGKEALDRIVADPNAFDLLISDHHMPKMNGLELVARVRELPFHGKILIFSSELNPAVSDAYNELKVDRMLYKPVFPSELRQILAELFAPAAYVH